MAHRERPKEALMNTKSLPSWGNYNLKTKFNKAQQQKQKENHNKAIIFKLLKTKKTKIVNEAREKNILHTVWI